MSDLKRFRVTDEAVAFVAGRRVPDDRTITMTDEEARYDVLAGVLTPVEDAAPRQIADEAAAAGRRSKG